MLRPDNISKEMFGRNTGWNVGQLIAEGEGGAFGVLRQSTLFRDLDDGLFADICRDSRVVDVDRGQILFQQHDPATHFYVVLDGWMKVYRMSARGDEAVIGIFTRGDSFAEIAALAGRGYPASAEAVSNARLAAIAVDRLVGRISHDPRIALAMLASMSQQVHRLVDEIEQMKGLTGIQRVAEFLYRQCKTTEGSCVVSLPYEKSLIARKLGMKAESLSRVFQRLRASGIDIHGETATIGDVATLRAIVERDEGAGAR